MKFHCEKSTLESAVQLAGRAVSSRSSLPILSHVLLRAEGSLLHLSATDLETSIQCQIEARVSEEGSCTIPARVLAEVVGELPEGEVQVATAGNMTEFRCRQTFFKVNSMAGDEYPTLPQPPRDFPAQMPQRLLRVALRSVGAATASQEETRAVLQGVHMTLSGAQATFVATDGRRLAKMELALPAAVEPQQVAILPGRAVSELQKILKDTNEVIEFSINDGQIFFRLPSMVMSSRLLEGKFPNYRNLLPNQFATTITIDRELFATSVRRTLVMAQERVSPRLVRLNFEGDNLHISANAPDLGAASDVVPITKNGADIEIAFNGKFLLDGLQTMVSGEVQVLLNEPASAALVKPVEGAIDHLYLIMPVRIQKEEAVAVGAGAAG